MPDDRIVAHHECGHVIAAYALGRSIASVELTDSGGEFRPYERASWEPTAVEDKKAFRDAVLDSIGPQHLEEMLPTMISLSAGLAAQRRLVGRTHDDYADKDLDQVEGIARAVTSSAMEACHLVAHAMEQADQIVARHWHAVEALASELLLCRKLGADDIRSIIEHGPAARRRMRWDDLTARTKAAFGGTLVARSTW